MIDAAPATPEALFRFWQDVFGASRARLDAKRRRLILQRLEDGYSVEDLQLACLGCRSSSWHMGDNDRGTRYTSPDLIFRDADHVDRFIEIAEHHAERLSRSASRKAAESAAPASPAVPIPDSSRARINALLGQYLKRPVKTIEGSAL